MIVVAGGLAKAGHGEWGVCLIAGYCILFSAAAQLRARARNPDLIPASDRAEPMYLKALSNPPDCRVR